MGVAWEGQVGEGVVLAERESQVTQDYREQKDQSLHIIPVNGKDGGLARRLED